MTDFPVKTRKKLIEVALPLEAINIASAREKSIRHGHPSTLHLWWARRPLAAARAVIFSQMVDDPSEYVDTLLGVPEVRRAAERELKRRKALWDLLPDDADREDEPALEGCAADIERERLFEIIRQLVKWENTTNEHVLDKARAEIWQSWRRACADNAGHPRAAELFDRNKLPAFHDPFAGGGAIPLEAQRLGLEAHASDLNPVAVLINKAMIEIPPRFASMPPVNPKADKHRHYKGAEGLAEDVRYYGQWMRDEAEKRIGHLYPKVAVTEEMAAERPDLKPYVGRKLTVIAWIWARTVKSPNPAFRDVDVPLASTFMLYTKPGLEAYVEPVVSGSEYEFQVRPGKPADMESVKTGTKMGHGSNFRCVVSGAPISGDYIKSEGTADRLGERLMAMVVSGDRERLYVSPSTDHEAVINQVQPDWLPSGNVPSRLTGGTCVPYGFDEWSDLFTPRQTVALSTFSALVAEARQKIAAGALRASENNDASPLAASAYADAVATYLAFVVSRMADRHSALCRWDPNPGGYAPKIASTFGRQAFPMIWDHAEANPFSSSSGNFLDACEWVANVVSAALPASSGGTAVQGDARRQEGSLDRVVSTDPPYYDNIGYADLSDFFYVWLRKSLAGLYPDVFSTVATPKTDELVALAHRHGGKSEAEAYFLKGMVESMGRIAGQSHPAFPTTIYYAFKQAEAKPDGGISSTGWDTFLDALMRAGLGIQGTWPMRTELSNRMVGTGTNALASSIVLVCRPRNSDVAIGTRRQFLGALRSELPTALAHLQRGNIAPVDLAQAAIGPGMAVFTRYSKVVNQSGESITVREALALINEVLDEVLAAQEGDFDADTRWALTWFDENGFTAADYGRAEQLSKAKNTSVASMADAKNGGIIFSRAGKVRLRRPVELAADWDPQTDPRLTVWEMVHHLIRLLEEGGEAAAGSLAAKLGVRAETARELAYRLYTAAERRKRAADALPYNALVQSWPEIMRLAREAAARGAAAPAQAELMV